MNVAAIDIGTNSARLLITDGQGQELAREMHITRLGQGVDVHGTLSADAIERTLEVLARFAGRIAEQGARRVRAVATSAARDAANRDQFFEGVERVLGVRPELITGDDEALLSFRGATAKLPPEGGPYLVVDIGGGSTEFVLGDREPRAWISVQLGCVRMTERHLTSDPPSASQIAACLADVQGELSRVAAVIEVRQAKRLIGLAGTVTALAALKLGLREYDASRTHHTVLARDEVEALFARLCTATVEERRAMLAEPKRAEAIVGGAAVLVAILGKLSIPELLVSEEDILDGLAASLR